MNFQEWITANWKKLLLWAFTIQAIGLIAFGLFAVCMLVYLIIMIYWASGGPF